MKEAICEGDCLDSQVKRALKLWPTSWNMTMLPDVAAIADVADEVTSKEEMLEQAEKEEW